MNDIKKLTNASHRELVCRTYNSKAHKYLNRSDMQCSNLVNLLDYMKSHGVLPKSKVLDVGCGIGTARRYIEHYKSGNIEYIGVDFSQGMLDLAKKATILPSTFLVADAELLPFDDSTFDFVISNSVYHWLHVPEIGLTPYQAWKEACRILKPGAILAFSISAEGTAKKFQKCYHRIANKYLKSNKFNKNLYRFDPIGSMNVSAVEGHLVDLGFEIILVSHKSEPVKFKNATHYVNAVEAYGFDSYMSPFEEKSRMPIWKEIKESFLKENEEGVYIHDQFMIYAIGRKPN